MNEASKTYLHYNNILSPYLQGSVLDIGAGSDMIITHASSFDVEDGNAELIDELIDIQFDCVFSSHCLEHMTNPKDALLRWAKLVNNGGSIIIIVPDEDLYEQGHFPSIFNSDHKATFTISKNNSWSPVSINVLDLISSLHNFKVEYLSLQDNNYNRNLMTFNRKRIRIANVSISHQLERVQEKFKIELPSLFRFLQQPMDQLKENKTLAQIMFILKRIQ
jgi:SAM-dependent methyltransferase